MLYPNGQRVLAASPRAVSGALAQSGAFSYGGIRGARYNKFVSNTYSQVLGAVPSGYVGKSWQMAVKAGAIAGFSSLSVAATGAGVLGMPGAGSASFSIGFANADGQMIASGSGSASMSFTAEGVLTGSINGTGSAAFNIGFAPALLGATADGSGSASFSIGFAPATMFPLDDTSPLRTGSATMTFTGLLTPYAIGHMQGSTVDTSVLTVDAIAAGVLAAALTSPIYADIRRVNAVTVTGTGAPGSEWGP